MDLSFEEFKDIIQNDIGFNLNSNVLEEINSFANTYDKKDELLSSYVQYKVNELKNKAFDKANVDCVDEYADVYVDTVDDILVELWSGTKIVITMVNAKNIETRVISEFKKFEYPMASREKVINTFDAYSLVGYYALVAFEMNEINFDYFGVPYDYLLERLTDAINKSS